MIGFPPISAMCLTYGRPHLLEEAIHSFLIQDYPGPKELVVLNDFADQTLVCDHAKVRIINTSMRFQSVGEKRNACATLAKHDILFVWDDDDIYLPWRISLSIQRMQDDHGFYKSPSAWILSDGQLDGPSINLYHSASCFTRDLFERAGGYPHIGSGQDWGLEDRIRQLIPISKDDDTLTPQELYYLYRWHGTGSYHLSAFGRDEGQAVTGNQKVAEFVEGQVREGRVLTGMVRLQPAWRSDYLALVRSTLQQPTMPRIVEVVGTRPQKLPEPEASASVVRVVEPNPVIETVASQPQRQNLAAKQVATCGGLPLVSCVMPTYGRPDYVAESIAMFLAQDYPAKELIILNDCSGQKLLGDFPDVRILNSEARWPTLGEKRNAAIELARGQYIAVWDDDDIYMPWRLSHSMRRIRELDSPLYCPADYWAYWGSDDLHENQALLNWIYHPLVVFDKDLWRSTGGYPAQTLSEDTVFFKKVLEQLGTEWPRDPIIRHDRVMIMRAKSKYAHTSISGGSGGPDIRPGNIALIPSEIRDNTLRKANNRLIHARREASRRRAVSERNSHSWPGVPADQVRYWLDSLQRESSSVGFGEVGHFGNLGYEGKRVEVNGEVRSHSISAHAPSRLKYRLDGRFSHLCCHVAINDDVAASSASADFLVMADGQLAGIARNVRPGQLLRRLSVDIHGATEVELIVQPRPWNHCHSVWVDPFLVSVSLNSTVVVCDSLQRAEISLDGLQPAVDLCIATVGSPGWEDWVDDLFGSVCAHAQCPDALFAILFYGDSPEIRRVAAKYGARLVHCHPLRPLNAACKSVLYSIGRFVQARKYVCLDADMLVLDDLRPIVAAIDAAPDGSILACRNSGDSSSLGSALTTMYGGCVQDVQGLLCNEAGPELADRLVINDGLFAGTCAALCAVDDTIRSMDDPMGWIDDLTVNMPWRNQFVFNLALAHGACGIEVAPRFNAQLHFHDVDIQASPTGLAVTLNGKPVSIVHFDGLGKNKSVEWRGRYRQTQRLLPTSSTSTRSFEQYLDGLRVWLGTCDMTASTHANVNGRSGQDRGKSQLVSLDLLRAVHGIFLAHGCSRLIEFGTSQGVIAGCLAATVVREPDGIVVTIDHEVFPDRESLWSLLPNDVRSRIVARQYDLIDGLRTADSAGETYHAAILRASATVESVVQEVQMVSKVVCSGGLILVHGEQSQSSTIDRAMAEIRTLGLGASRVDRCDVADTEPLHSCLAIIENRSLRAVDDWTSESIPGKMRQHLQEASTDHGGLS